MTIEVVTSAMQYIGGIELKAMNMTTEEKIRFYEPHTFSSRMFCTLELGEAQQVMEYFSKRIEELKNISLWTKQISKTIDF